MHYFVRSRHYKINPFGLTVRQKLYINSLTQELGWDEGHLRNFISKYYHKSALDSLTKQEAIKVIESLKSIKFSQKR